jgi:hypothetical protein
MKTFHLVIPFELSEYVFKNRLFAPFTVFLYLKMSGEKIGLQSDALARMGEVLGIKDNRTAKAHLEHLIALNWIGFNSNAGIYHVRSFRYLREQYGFAGKTGTIVRREDLSSLKSYLAAAIISRSINAQKHSKWLFVKRKMKPRTATRSGVANQSWASLPFSQHLPYFGLGTHTIAKLLGVSQPTACRIKLRAAKDGYLKLSKRFEELCVLNEAMPALSAHLVSIFPTEGKKCKIIKKTINGIKCRVLVKQLHDEIDCQMKCKRLNNI